MVVELTTVGSIMSIVCIHVVVCVSSSKQQCKPRACQHLYVTGGGLMTVVSIVSVVCINSVIQHHRFLDFSLSETFILWRFYFLEFLLPKS